MPTAHTCVLDGFPVMGGALGALVSVLDHTKTKEPERNKASKFFDTLGRTMYRTVIRYVDVLCFVVIS